MLSLVFGKLLADSNNSFNNLELFEVFTDTGREKFVVVPVVGPFGGLITDCVVDPMVTAGCCCCCCEVWFVPVIVVIELR